MTGLLDSPTERTIQEFPLGSSKSRLVCVFQAVPDTYEKRRSHNLRYKKQKSVVLWHPVGEREYEEKARKKWRCGKCKRMMRLVPHAETFPGWKSPSLFETSDEHGVLYRMEHVVKGGDQACEMIGKIVHGARV